MKAKLIKREDRYDLYGEDGSKIASSAPNPMRKLSINNCEAIENGYDLDELASERLSTRFDENSGYHKFVFVEAYKEGFQKALEILGDKKFSEEDVLKELNKLNTMPNSTLDTFTDDDEMVTMKWFEQSLQQTEWDVEILTKPFVSVGLIIADFSGDVPIDILNVKQEVVEEGYDLDTDGCLILKRI